MLNTRQIIAIVVISIAAIGLIAGGIYFYNVREQAKIKKSIEEADKLHHSGEVEKSIPLFEQTLKGAEGKLERITITAKLATDLFLTGDPGNQKRAVKMIKDEIANRQNSLLERAYLTLSLGSFYFLSPTDEFRRAIIFDGEPYQSFLEGSNFPLAERKIYEYGNSFTPTAIGELRVAYWYAQELMINDSLTPAQKRNYVDIINLHSNAGANLIERDRKFLEPSRTYQAKILAVAIQGILVLNDFGRTKEQVESMFEETISSLEASSGVPANDVHTNDFALQARFQYGSYLAHAYGASHAKKIAEVVQPIIDTKYRSSFVGYLRNMAIHRSPTVAKQDHYPSARELALIAQASPEFRDFLNRLGGRF